jgi:hypothetical protein
VVFDADALRSRKEIAAAPSDKTSLSQVLKYFSSLSRCHWQSFLEPFLVQLLLTVTSAIFFSYHMKTLFIAKFQSLINLSHFSVFLSYFNDLGNHLIFYETTFAFTSVFPFQQKQDIFRHENCRNILSESECERVVAHTNSYTLTIVNISSLFLFRAVLCWLANMLSFRSERFINFLWVLIGVISLPSLIRSLQGSFFAI